VNGAEKKLPDQSLTSILKKFFAIITAWLNGNLNLILVKAIPVGGVVPHVLMVLAGKEHDLKRLREHKGFARNVKKIKLFMSIIKCLLDILIVFIRHIN